MNSRQSMISTTLHASLMPFLQIITLSLRCHLSSRSYCSLDSRSPPPPPSVTMRKDDDVKADNPPQCNNAKSMMMWQYENMTIATMRQCGAWPVQCKMQCNDGGGDILTVCDREQKTHYQLVTSLTVWHSVWQRTEDTLVFTVLPHYQLVTSVTQCVTGKQKTHYIVFTALPHFQLFTGVTGKQKIH